jgi:hypothetical protein
VVKMPMQTLRRPTDFVLRAEAPLLSNFDPRPTLREGSALGVSRRTLFSSVSAQQLCAGN